MTTSPLPWMGGKHSSAPRIVRAFPHPGLYDTCVDLFGGGANVLLARPATKYHTEVYNDANGDLVNFWMQCRDRAKALEERLDTLPYSRELYYQYHSSLYKEGETLDSLERAVRWFYVLRSSFNAREEEEHANGWSASVSGDKNSARAYRTAVALLGALQKRMRNVLIDCRDFEKVFASYNQPRTLFYCDPPYIGTEHYYKHPFNISDHERLAELLNASSAFVALSYYPHDIFDSWYPADRWRRVTWSTPKHSQRKEQHEYATELLLCNYPPTHGTLWEEMDA